MILNCDPSLAVVRSCQVLCSQCGLNLRVRWSLQRRELKCQPLELTTAEAEEKGREKKGVPWDEGAQKRGMGVKELYIP